MPYLLFFLLCVCWGSNFILMKKANLCFDAMGVAAWRVGGGFVVLFAVWLLRRGGWSLQRKHVAPILLVVLIGYVWPFIAQPWLVERCGSGFIGSMVFLVPLLTVLVSIPMLGIYPTLRQLFGVLGGLFFLGLILSDGVDNRDISWGYILLALTVPLCYALCNTYIRRKFVGVGPLSLSMCALGLSWAILLPASIWTASNPVEATSPISVVVQEAPQAGSELSESEKEWVAISAALVLGIVGTGAGIFMFNYLLQTEGPLFAGMVTYLIPAVAVIWGWIDGEPVTLRQLTGLVGVLVMVSVVQFGAAGKGTIPVESR